MNQDIYVLVEHLRKQVADITFIMLAAAQKLAKSAGGKVVAVLLGHNDQQLANNLAADLVLYADSPTLADFKPDAYVKVLASLIKQETPRALLIGQTSIGGDIAGMLSAELGLPLIGSCVNFHTEGKETLFISQICGGKIMVEGELPTPCALVSMMPGVIKPEAGLSQQAPQISTFASPSLEGAQVSLKQYIEPEAGDVDISKESILIAVGRGIQNQDNLELAEELSNVLGGVVCASRPVVDQGWLPTSRLVGKSGKQVKPKIYLTLGISGAPEHVEAITSSETIIAINTDPAAPIFNIAKYGTVADLFELVPILTEHIQKAKG